MRYLSNRSMPQAQVIPELAYEDVVAAARWLCDVFGFEVRLRIGTHRVQLDFGTGSLVVRQGRRSGDDASSHSVMVRVSDVDAHYARAVAAGAVNATSPETYPFGERQYSVDDLGGHSWTFSQSVQDVDPRSWGGVPGGPDRQVPPKYSLPEIERRWLVDLARVGSLALVPYSVIEDSRWLNSRLRLRKVQVPGGGTTFKLGIKYGKVAPVLQPITNLYLNAEEYESLLRTADPASRKRRYEVEGGSLDVYELPADSPAYFEVEFDSEHEAHGYEPPSFVTEEIT